MNNYRKIIKTRILLLAILIILSIILGIYDVFWADPELKETAVYGYQTGIIISLGLLSTITVIRYRALLKDEHKLLLNFNRENDERIKAIKAKAGIPILPILSVLIIVAGLIAGHYSELIFITLIAVATFLIVVCSIVKMIFIKRM